MPRINLSVSQELYEKISSMAAENQKTVNHEVVDSLEQLYLGKASYDYEAALEKMKMEAQSKAGEFTLADLPTFASIEFALKDNPNVQPAVVRAKLGKMFNEEIKNGNVPNIDRATMIKDGEEKLKFLSRAAVYYNLMMSKKGE